MWLNHFYHSTITQKLSCENDQQLCPDAWANLVKTRKTIHLKSAQIANAHNHELKKKKKMLVTKFKIVCIVAKANR